MQLPRVHGLECRQLTGRQVEQHSQVADVTEHQKNADVCYYVASGKSHIVLVRCQ